MRITIDGDIDIATLSVFGDAFEACRRSGGRELVLDMSGVRFMDSQGLHMLLATDQAMRDLGGNLVVASPSPAVRRLLDVSGLQPLVAVDG